MQQMKYNYNITIISVFVEAIADAAIHRVCVCRNLNICFQLGGQLDSITSHRITTPHIEHTSLAKHAVDLIHKDDTWSNPMGNGKSRLDNLLPFTKPLACQR